MGRNIRHYYPLLVVLVMSSGILGAVCGHDFIAYDDEINIYGNRFVTNFTFVNFLHFWSGLYQNLYIPLTYNFWLVIAKVANFFPASAANTLNPFPFHAANLLFHLGCTSLVYLIVQALVDDEWGAAAGAMLFAVHPVQVEAVSWATGLKDVLSGFWALLAVWQYVLYTRVSSDQRKRYLHYTVASAAFICAILSKPSALALPLAVALLGFLLMSRSPKLLAKELAPWMLVAIPVLLITKFAQPVSGQNFSPTGWQRLLVAGDAWTFYLTKCLWPWHLGADYGRTPQQVLGQGWWMWLSGVLPYLFLPLFYWRGNSYCRAALGISLAMLLPVSGFVSFDFQEYSTVADRYFYLAMLGPAVIWGWLVGSYRSWKPLLVAVVIVLGLCSLRSLVQVRHWQNGSTFYRNALAVNPHSWLAANNLGVISLDRKELPEAARLFEQALAAKPDYAVALNNLGAVHGLQGHLLSAQELFARALGLNPSYADAAANLGDIYLRRGELVRAREYYRRALEIKPDFADVHNALGVIASGAKQFPEALEHYQLALEYGPASVKLLNNLGVVYKELGRVVEAAECYQRALAIDPNSAEVHNNLGLIYFEAGRSLEAVAQFEQAGRLSPEQPQPFCNLGKALLASGQVESARVAFGKALSLNPGFAPALSGLAKLYRSVGREGIADDYSRKARALGFIAD
ncbi:MAG: tetratricopeptide repeat protein [Desulfobulbaceae bacterium]|nr:tetratricopeptide repeat protein [Desulfobulbaceae bacterium]